MHANDETMRRWLWRDVLKNTQVFHNNYLLVHAIISVVLIYIVGTFIDMASIRFLEIPFLRWCDKNVIVKCKKLQLAVINKNSRSRFRYGKNSDRS